MKFRHTTGGLPEHVELQMTPMIDIVFQLLAFFIMTLKIVTLEGDFNVKMPSPAREGPTTAPDLPPMVIRLRADDAGNLTGIALEGNAFRSFAELNRRIIEIVGNERGPGSLAESAEVEIDADYHLKYQHTVEAITAVSGYVTPDGHVVKLIEKIRFRPPEAR
jgi:biopolymer transport protein ExbD